MWPLNISIRVINRSKGVSRGSVADHAKIADAIQMGDGETAKVAMQNLIMEAQQLLQGKVPALENI